MKVCLFRNVPTAESVDKKRGIDSLQRRRKFQPNRMRIYDETIIEQGSEGIRFAPNVFFLKQFNFPDCSKKLTPFVFW